MDMNTAEWILVIMLACALLIFLITGIILIVKLIILAGEAKKIVITGQGIASKADDIVDNVKDMTTVGGIVKTFATHVMDEQKRKYAAEEAERVVAEKAAKAVVDKAIKTAKAASEKAKK